MKIWVKILGGRIGRRKCGEVTLEESARREHHLDVRTCRDIQPEDDAQTASVRIKVFAQYLKKTQLRGKTKLSVLMVRGEILLEQVEMQICDISQGKLPRATFTQEMSLSTGP